MAPAFSSSLAIAITQAATLVALALAVALLVYLLAARAARRLRERRDAPRTDAWREALHAAIYAPAQVQLPALDRTALPVFLCLWNRLQESVRGEAGENLAALLRGNGLVTPVRGLVGGAALGQSLNAITAIGHLRDPDSWEALAPLAAAEDPVLSFAAVRALFRIDPPRALDLFLAQAARREDWSLSRLGSILQEIGPDRVTPPMVRLLCSPPEEGLERLLKLARFAHREQVAGAVRDWLGKSKDPNVLGAGLDFIEDRHDRLWVRAATQHPAWRVRMAAARAIGRIGVTADQALLLDLLEDKSWWVRYRAAKALVSLPGLSRQEVEALRARTRDRFAADILAQVLAEVSR